MIASLVALLLAAAPAGASRCVLIVGTSDLHGHLAPRLVGDGAASHEAGGLARFGGILKGLRAGKEPVLLLDAGDLFQGTLESNLQHGRAVIAAYDVLGYDAATLGNHEFDFGPEAPDDGPQGALKARLAEAKFPFLVANLIDDKTGALPAWPNLFPSKLFVLRGLKVGVIGIANPETPAVTIRRYVEGVTFLDPVEPVLREAKALRAQGAQLVVLVAHLGGSCDLRNPEAKSCERPSQLLSLLEALPTGTVDVAVGGHTHRFMSHWINGVPALEAGAEGRYFSELEACALPQGGLDRQRAHLITPREIVGEGSDLRVDRVVKPFLDAVSTEVNRPLGPVLAAPLRRDYHALSPLGSMAAEAIRRSGSADVAVINAGGLRADLAAGPLTFGGLYEAFPFENHLVVVSVSGQELTDFINALGGSGHGYPQSAGLTVRGQPGAFALFGVDGQPLSLSARFRLATLDFLFHGGDGTQPVVGRLATPQVLPLAGDPTLRDAIVAYLKSR